MLYYCTVSIIFFKSYFGACMIKAFSPRERVSRSLHLWLCSSNKWRRLIKVVFTLERISKIANMRWHKTDTRPKLTPGLNRPFDDCCNDVFPLLERLTCNPGINTENFPMQNSFHSLSKIYYRCKHPSSGTIVLRNMDSIYTFTSDLTR